MWVQMLQKPWANLTVYMYQEEHALFIFSVLEETVSSEENKSSKETRLNLKPTFFLKQPQFPESYTHLFPLSFGVTICWLYKGGIKKFSELKVIIRKMPFLRHEEDFLLIT